MSSCGGLGNLFEELSPSVDVTRIRMGEREWKRVKSELNRIGTGFDVLLNISLVSHGYGHEHDEEDEHAHVHHHATDGGFVREVNNLILSLSAEFSQAEIHPHMHHNHAIVTLELKNISDVEKVIRKVVELVKECEECIVNGIDGEVRLGNDLVSIFFGDSYKMTFILPSSDGKKLLIIETHV